MVLLYQVATNKMLRDLEMQDAVLHRLPTDGQLACRYGVSRATIRKAVQHLEARGVIRIKGHSKTVIRLPREEDFFPINEQDASPRDRVTECLVDRLRKAKDEGRTYVAETELAKGLGCNRSIIREELARISHYGLVVKQPHRGWKIADFTASVLMQIFEVRELFETYAMRKLAQLPDSAPVWRELEYLQQRLRAVSRDDAHSLAKAVQMDKAFHDTLLFVCNNRYMAHFHNMCHLLIEYNLHYKDLSRERIIIGLDDHLLILEKLLARREEEALAALREHFVHARGLITEDAEGGIPPREEWGSRASRPARPDEEALA